MVMAALFLMGSVCMVSAAEETNFATRKGLRSQGAIHYQEGAEKVVIDSADLYTLADSLDLFKVRTAEQLGVLHTYLSKDANGVPLTGTGDIYVTHRKPAASEEINPRTLSFDTILEGIAASQTISTDPTAYGMSPGTTLYKGTDGKLYTGYQEGAEQIHIQAATPENLSAGAAAWVNGKLLLGTGEDNKTYQDKGSSGTATGDSENIFKNFNTIGGYYGGFSGSIPYTFTPGKSVLLLFDGQLKPTFNKANKPDSSVTGDWFSLYYWKSNPNTKIRINVEATTTGYNSKLLLKEW